MTHVFLASIGSASPSTGPELTQYLVVCAFLILLVGAMAWLFRRFVAGAVRARAAKRSLQVLDMLPLGGKQRVCVVRCYDRTFALGLGDKEVSLIAELDPVIGETPVRSIEPARPTFAALLRRVQQNHASKREREHASNTEGILG